LKGTTITDDDQPQGPLTEGGYLILVSMLEPRHGYAVMQHIAQLTNGRVTLGAGTLYGAINMLLGRGWIQAVDANQGSRKKQYVTTPQGRRVLTAEIERLEQLLSIGQAATERIKR